MSNPVEPTPTLSIEDIEASIKAHPPVVTPYPDDATATWVYWTPMDTLERGIADEWVVERLRKRRDALLAACDFRVVPDAPWDTAPWIAYRQELRDLPDATMDPRKAQWPTPPA